MKWSKPKRSKWFSEKGHKILKYRMANKFYYLLYGPNDPLEFGHYQTFESLRLAKKGAET